MATNDSMINSSWNAGDGYSYPDYLSSDYTSNSGSDYTVPLFGSSGYSLDPNNSLLYTNSSDALGAVPNYSSPTAAAESFSPGGSNALGTLGGSLGGMGNTAGAIGSGVSAISNAYNGASTDTTGSVLSGAASGAMAGAYFGPIGMAAGAIIGGIAGFFGSKSKKKAEKKAYQQQLEVAVAPQRQAQANWLQQQGLLQQGISNYKSAFTPGGYQYSNALLGGPTNKSYGIPTKGPSLPNFNQAPPDIVGGSPDKSLGITGNNVPNNGVNLNPGPIQMPQQQGTYTGNASNPYYGFSQPALVQAPIAPGFVSDKGQQQSNISNYQQQYQKYVQEQQQQAAAASMSAYQPYFNTQPAYMNGAYA